MHKDTLSFSLQQGEKKDQKLIKLRNDTHINAYCVESLEYFGNIN